MLDLLWLLLASVPIVVGLTIVLLALRERWRTSAVRVSRVTPCQEQSPGALLPR
jgi:hypothetical protein